MENILQIKNYEVRPERDLNGNTCYILSFDESSHIKVSSRAMSIIELLNGKYEKKEIVKILNGKGVSITAKELEYFIDNFLLPRNVLQGKDSKTLDTEHRKLWFHLPVIESSKFEFIYRVLKFMLYKLSIIVVIAAIVVCIVWSGIYLLQYEKNFIENINSLQILVLVYLSMFIHELGHATAAYKYGVHVGKMGIGIYLVYFIFFIDMTNTWRLDRKKRIVNDLSGIYFQMSTIIPIFIGYLLSGNVSLLCAAMVIMCTSLMNLIPFLRMDGYWLLTDFLNMQNVQIHAFESIKTFTKEFLMLIKSKFKHTDYTIDKKNMFYGVYSYIYVFSTGIMLGFIFASLIKLIEDRAQLISKIVSLYTNLTNGNINQFLLDLNNIFILLIPVIFVVSLLVSIINKLIKKGRCK